MSADKAIVTMGNRKMHLNSIKLALHVAIGRTKDRCHPPLTFRAESSDMEVETIEILPPSANSALNIDFARVPSKSYNLPVDELTDICSLLQYQSPR
ncbi:hypothetical protein XENTR_v10011560 [Xenopus tropicalis]|nr:hypothetical protein XENTR_v10011560 [Xenopus tropicalis]